LAAFSEDITKKTLDVIYLNERQKQRGSKNHRWRLPQVFAAMLVGAMANKAY
jgi:hypothetical protein